MARNANSLGGVRRMKIEASIPIAGGHSTMLNLRQSSDLMQHQSGHLVLDAIHHFPAQHFQQELHALNHHHLRAVIV